MPLFPLQAIDAFRQHYNVVIDIYGVPAVLYSPVDIDKQEGLDIYSERPDLRYISKQIKVFIEWGKDMSRLRRLGLHTEEILPIIGWFSNANLQRNSYIKVDIRYAEGEWGTDEFELINRLVKEIYNAVVVEAWELAPRRR